MIVCAERHNGTCAHTVARAHTYTPSPRAHTHTHTHARAHTHTQDRNPYHNGTHAADVLQTLHGGVVQTLYSAALALPAFLPGVLHCVLCVHSEVGTLCVCACVCVCERERETGVRLCGSPRGVIHAFFAFRSPYGPHAVPANVSCSDRDALGQGPPLRRPPPHHHIKHILPIDTYSYAHTSHCAPQ